MDETLAELGKLFRSFSKLVRERTEDYFGNPTPLDKSLREITDEDSCAVPNSLLRSLAKASHDPFNYGTIMQVVWSGLASDTWQWRRIYKSLALLQFLICLGPSRALDDTIAGRAMLQSLASFHHFDGQREEGGGVRQRADEILELLDDPVKLQSAKEQAALDAAKYVSIESKYSENREDYGDSRQSWGDLGGQWRSQSANNPFNTINRFQSASDAAKAWPIDERRQSEGSYDSPVFRTKDPFHAAPETPMKEEVNASPNPFTSADLISSNQSPPEKKTKEESTKKQPSLLDLDDF